MMSTKINQKIHRELILAFCGDIIDHKKSVFRSVIFFYYKTACITSIMIAESMSEFITRWIVLKFM